MALALRRKRGDKIQIGDNIIITLGETRGSWTTVLVEAPREISIHRIDGEASNGDANNTGPVPRKRRRH